MQGFSIRESWKVLAVLFAVSLGLVGCVHPKVPSAAKVGASSEPTPYQEGGYPSILGVRTVLNPFEYPYGYSEDELGDASYLILSATNIYTSAKQTMDIATLRAAELGRENGYDKFRVSYASAGYMCRDSSGFPHHVAAELVQYGRGDGSVGPDDPELIKRAERANNRRSMIRAVPINREYVVADVIRELGDKVRNPVADYSERDAAAQKFQTRCWGKR